LTREITMSRRSATSRQPSRRGLLRTGLATVAVLGLPAPPAGAADDRTRLHRSEQAEPEKFPFGWIRWLMNGQIDPQAEMTMGIVHFEPNQTNVLHIHPNSAEFLHMLSGTAEHLIDGKWVTLKAGDTLRIPKGVPHQARSKDQGYEALIVYDTPTRVMVPVKEAKPAGPAPAP
jgi:quercetin dioxygenase-like cupin family protein